MSVLSHNGLAYPAEPEPVADDLRRSLFDRPGLVGLMIAMYFLGVAALQSTAYWRWSTYTAYVMVAVFLFSFFRLRGVLRIPELWLALALTGWILMTSLTSEYISGSLNAAWYATKLYLVAVVVMLYCDSLPKLKLLLQAQVIGAGIIATAGALLGYEVVQYGGDRVLGLTGQANAFGWSLSDAVLSCLVLFPIVGKVWRLIIFGYFAVAFLAMLGAGSRSSAAAIMAGLGTYYFLEHVRNFRRAWKWALPVLVVLVAVPLVAYLYFPNSPLVARLTKRLPARSQAQLEHSDSRRLTMYRHSVRLFLQNPILGKGMGTFVAYSGTLRYAHSGYAELLFSTGLPGLALYLTFVGVLYFRLRKLSKWFRDDRRLRRMLNAASAMVIAFLVHCLFRVLPVEKMPSMLMAAMIGFSARLKWAAETGDHGAEAVAEPTPEIEPQYAGPLGASPSE